ncbi:MAG: HEPN domain-containing protein [Clostridiales bacterium]|nr:HEPN domain-containing protein [Clostridiales bacterium]
MSRKRKGDSKLHTDWYDYAKRDVAAARMLYNDPFTIIYGFFHCHQAAEKALKGYLLYCNGYAPDGHNLIYLCRKVGEKIGEVNGFLELCVDLNIYYIQARYPSDFKIEWLPEELVYYTGEIVKLFKILNKESKNKKRERK